MTTLSTYILLDRSGSMSGPKWENAIGSINTYVESLRKQDISADVTVVTFDSAGFGYNNSSWPNRFGMQMNLEVQQNTTSFDLLRKQVDISEFKQISINETSPRGGTPLYDATAKLIDLAETRGNERTAIIIMTDGEENSSNKYTLSTIRDRIASCQKRNWEVLFLGAEFNVESMAKDYGLAAGKFVNTRSVNMDATMNYYASATTAYAQSGTAVDTTSVKADLA